MHPIVEVQKKELRKLCQKLGIKRLYAFGSVVYPDSFNETSDLDFLIAFEEHLTPREYFDNYFKFQDQLRLLFNREIDVVTENSLSNPYFISQLNQEKVLLYES
jgi:predicted nucleotidyltransferase